ncbi:hypothetical protein LCGC14_1556340 [marine sediment metagenome]|uniref:HK97 gp10 family phage protein n=1 Tax=marine sediment metagenome TaxID=412755 RepID=A0A0F9J9T6_9ZZZZ
MAQVARVTGLRELDRALAKFPAKLARKVFRKAGSKAAEPIRKAARARVRSQFQEQTGKLARGIKKQIKIKSLGARGTRLRVKVGLSPVGSKVKTSESVFYGRFLEKGTINITADPFIEPAFDARAGEALRIFQSELRKGIDSAAREARR